MRILLLRRLRVALILITFSLLVFTLWPPSAQAMPVFINELHYDNVGADTGEGVELAGLAGTTIDGWRLWFYNGSTGSSYASLGLTGTFSDQHNGYGALAFSFSGIQNGSPDGIALVNGANQLLQFISYEGVFTAKSGVAENVLSADIGVAEGSGTAVGSSLQLVGDDVGLFGWQAATSSFGAINEGQQFAARQVTDGTQAALPVTPSWLLLMLGLLGMLSVQRKAG